MGLADDNEAWERIGGVSDHWRRVADARKERVVTSRESMIEMVIEAIAELNAEAIEREVRPPLERVTNAEGQHLEAEFRGYLDAMTPADGYRLDAAGVPLIPELAGVARIKVEGDRWYPAEDGKKAFITPIRRATENYLDLEALDVNQTNREGVLVDMVAWHPSRPGAWALREGDAQVLGNVQYHLGDERRKIVTLHKDPLDWLRAGGTGLAVLTKDPTERMNVIRDLQIDGRIRLDKDAEQKMKAWLSTMLERGREIVAQEQKARTQNVEQERKIQQTQSL